MKHEAYFNDGTGRWEIADVDAIPWRQFAEVSTEADAKRMAAASDLLEACDFLLTALMATTSPAWKGNHDWTQTEGYKQAIKAIAKAKDE